MVKLAKFIIGNLTDSKEFEITESEEDGRVVLEVVADEGIVGLIIGKGGNTIKNIRNLLVIKAAREDKSVSINVTAKA